MVSKCTYAGLLVLETAVLNISLGSNRDPLQLGAAATAAGGVGVGGGGGGAPGQGSHLST